MQLIRIENAAAKENSTNKTEKRNLMDMLKKSFNAMQINLN